METFCTDNVPDTVTSVEVALQVISSTEDIT